MRWLNVSVEMLQKVEFTQAEPAEVGCWLRLACYCAAQENGGLIHDCRNWQDRQWMIATGLMRADLQRPAKLWEWTKNGGLRIVHYPVKKEREVAAKREAGFKTAGMRWGGKKRQKRTNKNSSLHSSPHSSAISSVDAEGETEGETERETKPRAQRSHKKKTSHHEEADAIAHHQKNGTPIE